MKIAVPKLNKLFFYLRFHLHILHAIVHLLNEPVLKEFPSNQTCSQDIILVGSKLNLSKIGGG